MADYKNIKGFNIQYLDSDPPNPIEGQMWFNSTTQTLKGAEVGGLAAGTWASSGDMNTGRENLIGMGLNTAGLVTGGEAASVRLAVTESYNGTSWTEVADLAIARGNLGSAGTQTAGLVFGGIIPGASSPRMKAETESWNGSAWTEVNDLNTARYSVSGFGTQTAAIGATGGNPGVTASC
jgi:hypothetical protein